MLKLKNIVKTFYKGLPDEKVIFKDFNLEVKKGEFVTVIGGNGAGKSTLMNIISGTIFPESGNIFIDGNDVTSLPEFRRAKFIGRVFQDPSKGSAPNLTIEENLSLAFLRGQKRGFKFGVSKANTKFFKEKLAELNLGLEDRLTAKMGLLSGGQRQAVTLIMAVLLKPEILLLDEHTAALDPKSSMKILDLTEKITQNSKITTLMITHNMQNALNFGSRLLMLNQGKIEMDLSGDERKNLKFCNLQEKFNF